MFVHRHVGVLAALEILQLGLVVALDPARLVDRNRLPAARSVVLVLQTVLNHLELQRAHRADDPAAVERAGEELRHAFVHELVDALGELLELQRIGILDVAELFRRERRYARELQFLALGEGVADLEVAGVVQTHDVARPCRVDHRLLLGHESRGRRELHLLAAAHVQVVAIALERARADLHEGDAVAVVGVHVGVDLEDEARHLRLPGLHGTRLGGRRTRRGSDAHEALQELAHAEVIDRRPEEDGSQLAAQVGVAVEGVVDPLHQFDVRTQLRRIALAHMLRQLGRREVGDLHRGGIGRQLLVGGEEREVLLVEVVHALEGRTVGYGESQRPHADAQLALHLVQQVEGILRRTVELVDEDDHRRRTHAAHLHQLARLRLHALGAVDDDDDRVHGRERAVGIFGEVLVARRIEDVDLVAPVFEAHDGRGDRDASLALDLHEVGGRPLLDLIALDGTRHVDRTAEQQQLLGKGRLTRIGVCDHGERAPAHDFFL